jgi:hypothetical protein
VGQVEGAKAQALTRSRRLGSWRSRKLPCKWTNVASIRSKSLSLFMATTTTIYIRRIPVKLLTCIPGFTRLTYRGTFIRSHCPFICPARLDGRCKRIAVEGLRILIDLVMLLLLMMNGSYRNPERRRESGINVGLHLWKIHLLPERKLLLLI